MNYYKSLFYYRILFAFIAMACIASAMKASPDQKGDGCDVDFEFCESPAVSQIINDTQWDIQRNCNKEGLVGALNSFGVIKLLEQNFFLRSNNINSRSLLDYPEFLPFRHDADKKGLLISLFYNQTPRCYFTRSSTNICSYLAVSQSGFINALDNVFNNLAEANQLSINKQLVFDLLDLFSPFSIEERRFGLMLCSKQKFGFWHASMQLPWYWLERNHITTPAMQEEIAETVAQITGVPVDEVDQNEQNKFQNAHFISDKLGLGDTRFMIDHAVFKKKYWTMRVGGLITVPTAFTMQHGLRGSKLCRLSRPPLLDLCALYLASQEPDPLLAQAGLQTATNFFLGALDNLGGIILDTPLGHNGHLELGAYMKNKFPVSMYINESWARRLVWRSFTAIQYQLPAWEMRSFILPVDITAFNAQTFVPVGSDAQILVNAQQAYDFLIAQFSERLFPIALNAKIHPSWIFRMTSHVCYEAPKGGFSIGSDTWIRAGEKITDVQAPAYLLKRISVCTAEASFAYQAKVYGSVFFKRQRPGQLWAVGLSGDYTYWNRGIGQDFTLIINADVTF